MLSAILLTALVALTGCDDSGGFAVTEYYRVMFYPQGGTPAPAAQTVLKGDKALLPASPLREGYTLAGWFTEEAAQNRWDFDNPVTGDLALYARWAVLEDGTWELSFNSQGGPPVEALIVADGETAARPPDPTRPDFDFQGWYKEAVCENPWDFAVDRVTAHTTLYAKWTAMATEFAVAFDAQGGIPVPAAQTVARGGKALTPPDPVLEGHTLIGWFTEVSALNRWDFDTPVTRNLALYAKWSETVLEEGTWELSFNSQGGPPVEAQIVADGETAVRPPEPERQGYYFDGWYKEAACENLWDFDTDTVTAHASLYAKWTVIVVELTVRFNAQGGTPAPANQTVAQGGKATRPTVARDGFMLLDWALAPLDGPAWDFAADTVEEDLTLYARWTELAEDQAALAFDALGGAPVPPAQAVAKGGKATRPASDPERNGFAFDGWFKEPAGLNPWDFAVDTVDADTTIYAKWTALYTVTFDTRGGNVVPSVTIRAGSGLKAPKPEDPVRGPDRFEGWYSSITGAPWNFDSALTGSITLYAQWTALYTVTFDSRGGGAVPRIEGLLEGSFVTQPADPVRDKNVFAGWHSDAAYTRPWDFALHTVTANTTLYAKWIAAVSFDANGGAPTPDPQTLTSGSRVAQPANPILAGKSFAGWRRDAVDGPLWDFASGIVNGDMTLYANWELVPVSGINNVPAGGGINTALDLGAAAVVPSNASFTTIVWTLKSAGSTGTGSSAPFIPSSGGTLVLTATVQGGGEGGADYVRDFTIVITTIREVTDIVNVPAEGFVDMDVDLGGAEVLPADATNKTIVWSVKTPGAGITSLSGSVFRPTAEGTLVLTATIVNGSEDDSGNLSDYTEDFTITVYSPQQAPPGGVGLGNDTTIDLLAGTGTTPLPRDSTITVVKNSTYYVRIANAYTGTVWHLNGTRSTATGNRLYLDTGKTGTVRLTVEAKNSNGELDSGTYVFKIE
jgi:uncharacterized repeat protein (TIGR02543 family)